MSKNIHQVYVANPITVNTGTDLVYFGQSPYGPGNDAAMLFSSFSAQFVSPTIGVNNAVLTTNASGVLTALPVIDGQIIIGSSIGPPVAATITQGTGVTITNDHNTIQIALAAGYSFIWNDVPGSSLTTAGGNGYINSNVVETTYTLPTTIPEGEVIGIAGKGAGGWILQCNMGQVIHLGNTPTSSGGSLASTNEFDSVQIVCTTANTTFTVIACIGNLTVA